MCVLWGHRAEELRDNHMLFSRLWEPILVLGGLVRPSSGPNSGPEREAGVST